MGGSGRTPYATENHNTSQKSVRNPNVTPWLIVIHHAASTSFDGVVKMELGTKQVSSTVVVKDSRVASMFDEQYRAWSLSSTYYDSVSLSSETCNSGGAAEGWPISEQSYHTLAKICATWCKKYGIPANRERIIGHREVYTRYGASYATACPGGIDLDRLVRLTNDYLTGSAGGGYVPIEEDDMFSDDDRSMLADVRAALNAGYRRTHGRLIDEGDLGLVTRANAEIAYAVAELKQIATGTVAKDGFDGEHAKLDQIISRLSALTAPAIDTSKLASDIAAKIVIPAGASKADVEAAVSTAFGKVFK